MHHTPHCSGASSIYLYGCSALLNEPTHQNRILVAYCCLHQQLKEVLCWPEHVALVRSWITASSTCATGTRGLYVLGRRDRVRRCSFIAEGILEMSAGKSYKVVACHVDRSQHVDTTRTTTANRFPVGKEKASILSAGLTQFSCTPMLNHSN